MAPSESAQQRNARNFPRLFNESGYRTMRHPILAAGLIELFEAQQREKHRPGAISTHDLVFPGALRLVKWMLSLTSPIIFASTSIS
jgi:hypothetical protein